MDGGGGGLGLETSPSPVDVYHHRNNLLRRRNSIPQPVVVDHTCLSNLHHQQTSSSDASSGTSSSSSSNSSSSTSTSSASSGEFDLIPVKSVSYVSLRDLLRSSAVNSPKPKSSLSQNPHLYSCSEISIRNPLVKQAAWAYLQPMPPAPDSSNQNSLRRLWDQFTGGENPLVAIFRFFNRHVFGTINRFFDWLLRSIWVRRSR